MSPLNSFFSAITAADLVIVGVFAAYFIFREVVLDLKKNGTGEMREKMTAWLPYVNAFFMIVPGTACILIGLLHHAYVLFGGGLIVFILGMVDVISLARKRTAARRNLDSGR